MTDVKIGQKIYHQGDWSSDGWRVEAVGYDWIVVRRISSYYDQVELIKPHELRELNNVED